MIPLAAALFLIALQRVSRVKWGRILRDTAPPVPIVRRRSMKFAINEMAGPLSFVATAESGNDYSEKEADA